MMRIVTNKKEILENPTKLLIVEEVVRLYDAIGRKMVLRKKAESALIDSQNLIDILDHETDDHNKRADKLKAQYKELFNEDFPSVIINAEEENREDKLVSIVKDIFNEKKDKES